MFYYSRVCDLVRMKLNLKYQGGTKRQRTSKQKTRPSPSPKEEEKLKKTKQQSTHPQIFFFIFFFTLNETQPHKQNWWNIPHFNNSDMNCAQREKESSRGLLTYGRLVHNHSARIWFESDFRNRSWAVEGWGRSCCDAKGRLFQSQMVLGKTVTFVSCSVGDSLEVCPLLSSSGSWS